MKSRNLTQDERKSFTILSRSLAIDESDVQSTNKEYDDYLHLAVENYIQCLLHEDNDESSTIFRLFGLWFSNMNDGHILSEMQDHYKKIPTYKFIALMPQMTAHLSSETIKDFIEQIVSEY